MNLKCSSCGTELSPATSFCRQCGTAITGAESQSEQPTAIFDQDTELKTQRLEPRATGEPVVAHSFRPSSHQPHQTLRWSVIAAILSVLLICVIGGAWLVVMRGSNRTSAAALVYPGARTVVDMKHDDGGRSLQLETDDSFSKVESWYNSNLKWEKTMRLTEGSVVLKNDSTTITLVSDDQKTSVLIKMAP